MKSFLGNFYRHLVILFLSHCLLHTSNGTGRNQVAYTYLLPLMEYHTAFNVLFTASFFIRLLKRIQYETDITIDKKKCFTKILKGNPVYIICTYSYQHCYFGPGFFGRIYMVNNVYKYSQLIAGNLSDIKLC